MELWTPDEKLNYIYAFIKYDNSGVELDFWQDDFIKNRNRFICLLKSRQTGFSFVVALKGLVKALDPARTKYTKQFVSYNEDDAREKIRYALEFYESIPDKYKKKLVHKTATMLEFEDIGGKTTSRLISLPCRPPRGKNGDVCLDEFAIYLPRLSKEIYTAASFCTLRRGCIEVGSTPLGTIGKFYEICTNKQEFSDFDHYFIPWWYAKVMCKDVKAAVTEAREMSTAERVNKFGTPRLVALFNNSALEDFQQECECTFIDSASSYISLELIYANTPGRREDDIPMNIEDDEVYFNANRNVEIKAYSDPDELILTYNPKIHGSPLFMGVDIGRYNDLTVFYIIGIFDDKKRTVARIELKNTDYDTQSDIFKILMKQLPIYRCCVDDGGLGNNLAENWKKEFNERLEKYHFDMYSKEVLAMGVKTGLERREFLLENDREFHAQIHSIKRTPTSGGNFRYDAERNEKGHADSFWAWALANHAATDAKKIGFYAQYASQKQNFAIQSSVVSTNNRQNTLGNPNGNRAEHLTHRRGKSLDSVVRGFTNVWK